MTSIPEYTDSDAPTEGGDEGWDAVFEEEEQIIVGAGIGSGDVWIDPDIEEGDEPPEGGTPDEPKSAVDQLADESGFTIWDFLFEDGWEVPAQEWWIPGVLPKGGSIVSVLAEPKVGKSLLLFDWAVSVATGRRWLDLDHEQRPAGVLYLDYELTRLQALRYLVSVSPRPEDRELLRTHFKHQSPPGVPTSQGFAEIRSLDGPRKIGDGQMMSAGEWDLHRVWESAGKPTLVVFDTMAMTLEGSENDAETMTRWYRSVAWLKREGVTVVRVDHLGKDTTRGARGSSAKAGQIDLQWTLFSGRPGEMGGEVIPDKQKRGWVTMRSSYDRTGEALEEIVLLKAAKGEDQRLWSRADEEPFEHDVIEVAKQLDAQEVPLSVGVKGIRAHWSVTGSTDKIYRAQQYRRQRSGSKP